MKRSIKLAVAAAVALTSTAAFATNGSNLTGLGAKARGMGGVGIGMSHGAESALTNPSLISEVEGTEVSFGGTVFMPKVTNTDSLGGPNSTSESKANLSVIPEVSIAQKVSDSFTWGIGMFGTAGMGTDYRSTNTAATGGTQMKMVTNVQLMQFGVPLVYSMNNFHVGITPLLQYGSLDINYEHPMTGTYYGAGVAQDMKFGYNIGASYKVADLTLGAVYKSRIDMNYKGVLSTVVAPFSATGTYANDKLSTPAEMGIGASYKMGASTVALDYKKIKWSDAKGYQDFMWKDQNVYVLGYEYATSGWAARAGYNYAKSPIANQTYAGLNNANLQSGTVNTFNLLGFPGIVQSHYSVGGTYNVSKQTSIDLAYMYAPEVTNTYKNFAGSDITTKHSQKSVSAQLNFKF